MTRVKFVENLPDGNPRGGSPMERQSALVRLRNELAKHPGQWAEVQREPRERERRAQMRSQYLKRNGLESTTRMVGEECIVFARVTA